ncbi:restriction endonuclease [Nocardia sp. BSTN01]|uniref:restriction endonuclease n=1 Tax=Nocardia sp. BSTN01 TaxID=2783665 RepID=UPI00188DF07F|nr:restriction endonuclease [Nocardia sp. BSTN01]MBF4998429.1 restriction endonuclease [Nocardia sp. BSTN01]
MVDAGDEHSLDAESFGNVADPKSDVVYLGRECDDLAQVVPKSLCQRHRSRGAWTVSAARRNRTRARLGARRQFSVTSARIAILTNGREYQVFTDGDRPNIMDSKPFLVFDILDMDNALVPEVAKLSKKSFDLDSIVSAAEELKYIGQIKRLLALEVKNPTDDWVRYFTTRIYEGKATQRIVDQFRVLVAKAAAQFIADQVSDRLNSALGENTSTVVAAPAEAVANETVQQAAEDSKLDDDIVTTEEELDGFNIVRAILAKEVDPNRVHYRDGKVYFAILLDDNNRKPVVRLHFNAKSVKFITTFENGKDGERHDIESVVDLYQHADRLLATVKNYG